MRGPVLSPSHSGGLGACDGPLPFPGHPPASPCGEGGGGDTIAGPGQRPLVAARQVIEDNYPRGPSSHRLLSWVLGRERRTPRAEHADVVLAGTHEAGV